MERQIISTFREGPKTQTAKWAMGLGLASFFAFPMLGTFAAAIRPLIDKVFSEKVGAGVGFAFGFVIIGIIISALIVSIKAFKLGERSWVVWFGLVPSIIGVLLLLFLLVGEFLFPH